MFVSATSAHEPSIHRKPAPEGFLASPDAISRLERGGSKLIREQGLQPAADLLARRARVSHAHLQPLLQVVSDSFELHQREALRRDVAERPMVKPAVSMYLKLAFLIETIGRPQGLVAARRAYAAALRQEPLSPCDAPAIVAHAKERLHHAHVALNDPAHRQFAQSLNQLLLLSHNMPGLPALSGDEKSFAKQRNAADKQLVHETRMRDAGVTDQAERLGRILKQI